MPDQPQPDIQQRIAAIIRDNSYKNDDDRWLFDFNTDPDDIAEVIVAELGLIEETAFRFTHNDSGRSSILTEPGDVRVARKITESHNLTEVSRYVSEWVPDA